MKNLNKEYDAFGPWIIEITNQEDVPEHFDSFYIYNREASVVLKIPINISRRNVRPGDILYKSLVAFEKDQIIALDWKNGKVLKETVKYNAIRSIQNKVDLLNGRLIIHSDNKSIEIPYNTVSKNLISDTVFNLRKKYIDYFTKTKIDNQIMKDYSHPTNYFFKGILTKIKEKETVFILDTQETKVIEKLSKNWYDPLIDIYNPMLFQKNMLLTNNKELIIISRKNGLKRKRSSDYSHINTYIPLENLINIRYESHELYSDIYKVSFNLPKINHIFYVQKPLSDFLVNKLILS